MKTTLSITIALLAVGAAGAGLRPTIIPLVREGDMIPGVGEATSFGDMAINSAGQWVLIVDTNGPSGADGVILSDSAVFAHEGQPVTMPQGTTINTLLGVSIDAAERRLSWFTLNGADPMLDSGLYVNNQLVVREGDYSGAIGFGIGTRYLGFLEAKINDNRQVLLIASVDDLTIPSSVDRAAIRLHLSSGGALVTEQLLAKEGDTPIGVGATVVDIGFGPHQTAINSTGQALYRVQLNAPSDRDQAIYLNNSLIARESEASPVAGRVFENLNNRALSIGDHGDFIFKADLDGDTSTDYILVRNGVGYRQEGHTAPPIAPYSFVGNNAFGAPDGPIYVDMYGTVLHYAEWNDPDTSRDSGLLLGDTLLIQEGATVIDNQLVDRIESGPYAFALSPNGRYLIFRATLEDNRDGVYLAELRRCPDVDQDGTVDLDDLAVALSSFAVCAGDVDDFPLALDVDYSGCVDLPDLAYIFSLFGKPCQ